MAAQQRPGQLKIGSWNTGGLRTNRDVMGEMLEREDFDVLALQETKMPGEDYVFRYPGYEIYRNDVEANSGGTAILVKRTLEHYSIPTPNQLRRMEATLVEVRTSFGRLRIISAYNRPLESIEEEDLALLLPDGKQTILIGDLNAKSPVWNSTRRNRQGRLLEDLMEMDPTTLVVGPPRPTYHSRAEDTPEVLDIAIIKECAVPHEITNVAGGGCHEPILLSIGQGEILEERKKTRTDWLKFRRILGQIIGPIPEFRQKEDIDQGLRELEGTVQEALQRSSTTETAHRHNRFGTISEDLKELIRTKNRARRRAQRSRREEDKRLANRLHELVKQELRNHRNKQWEANLRELDPNKSGLWNLQKALRQDRRPTPALHGPNGLAYTNEEKADAFLRTMERQFMLNQHDEDDMEFEEEVEEEFNNIEDEEEDENHWFTTPEEVGLIIKSVSAKKAPGRDGITNRALKHMPRKARGHLVALINGMLRKRHFPEGWKKADIVMIRKPFKDPTFPQNYRPISLLPAMSKVAEKVIMRYLKDETEALNVIPDEQFGFRQEHSADKQVLRLVEYVTQGFNRNQSTGAIFLDVSKAFDRVWQQGLIHKMRDQGYSRGLTKMLHSYLKGRSFRIKMGATTSNEGHQEAGVPQGAVLSSLLYSIYTADIPRRDNTIMSLYADDTAIAARSTQPHLVTRYLQEAADDIEGWCIKWKIAINPDKSQAVFFRRRRQRPGELIEMDGRNIQWTDKAKYLGVTLDKGLTFKAHVDATVTKTTQARGRLSCLIGRHSKLDLKIKLLLINQILIPIMMYASTVWGYTCKTNRLRIQSQQNLALRQATNAYRYVTNKLIFRELQQRPILDMMKDRARALFDDIRTHPNQQLRELTDYTRYDYRRHARPRKQIEEDQD